MNSIELLLLAVGLSMDAVAVAVCIGLDISKADMKKSLTVGLYFGVFQAVMPLIGYLAANIFAEGIISYDHWIAFALLCFLGIKMIAGSLKKDTRESKEQTEKSGGKKTSLTPRHMLPFALATSIDALAVGVSFAFLRVDIIPAVSFIGIVTLLLSMIGVKIGNMFGLKLKSKAEIAGGVILVLIGAKILLEHMDLINF